MNIHAKEKTKMNSKCALAAVAAVMAGAAFADVRVWLDELPIKDMVCGWGEVGRNKSVDGHQLKIGSKTYERGVGTHSESIAIYDVGGKAVSFDADVGLDAEVFPAEGGTASVKFIVRADGRTVAQTPVLKGSREGVHVHADLAGAKFVELVVSETGDGNTWDHSDWADAYFTMQDGAKPVPVKMGGEQLGILTPKAPASPRINGARIYGVRPGHPIVVTGQTMGSDPMVTESHTAANGRFVRHMRAGQKKPVEFNGVAEYTPPYGFTTQCQAELFWSTKGRCP